MTTRALSKVLFKYTSEPLTVAEAPVDFSLPRSRRCNNFNNINNVVSVHLSLEVQILYSLLHSYVDKLLFASLIMDNRNGNLCPNPVVSMPWE